MDTAQWPQEIAVKAIEEIIVTNKKSDDDQDQNKSNDQQQEALKCPRCNSGSTKFCYYNNYSLTQPRFFCKACRRYWTQGGSLRNIPVGGASRKINKTRSSSKIINNIATNNNRLPDLVQGQDLNLALTRDNNTKVNIDHGSNNSFGMMMINHSFVHTHPLTTSNSTGFSLIDNTDQDFKPSLEFSLDGINGSGVQESGGNNNGRLLFPFEDYLKGSNGINVIEPSNIKDQQDFPATGYWTEMLGGGSW